MIIRLAEITSACAAIRLVVINDSDLARLEALLDARVPKASKETVHRIGTEFHIKLAELGRNDLISHGVTDATTRLSRARWLDASHEHEGWDEHRAILAALRKGNKATAERLVQTHIRKSRNRLLLVLKENRRSLRARGAGLA